MIKISIFDKYAKKSKWTLFQRFVTSSKTEVHSNCNIMIKVDISHLLYSAQNNAQAWWNTLLFTISFQDLWRLLPKKSLQLNLFLFAGLLLWPTEELCVLYLSRTEIRPKIITTYSVPNPLIFAAKNSVILAESSLTLTCYISYYFTPKPKGL